MLKFIYLHIIVVDKSKQKQNSIASPHYRKDVGANRAFLSNTNTNTNTTVISIVPPTVLPMAHYLLIILAYNSSYSASKFFFGGGGNFSVGL